MRELFITELAKEILGPRNGLNERLDSSPLNEYLCGVLAPQTSQTGRDIEGDSEMMQGESQIYEDSVIESDIQTPPLLSPALDPKSRPSSMGLSFQIRAMQMPELDLCVTWAKYENIAGQNRIWERRPKYFIQTIRVEREYDLRLDTDSKITEQDDAEVSLHIRVRRRENNILFVSIYLVNRILFTPENERDYPTAEHHIFQPQVRIKCRNGVEIIPYHGIKSDNQQETELSFLYRNRPVLGRGHLCSVVWKDIDPERPYEEDQQILSTPSPPFNWIDGILLQEDERTKFVLPDIRTEFIPIYSIPSVKLDWPTAYGRSPELSADTLAETWDASELTEILRPISEGYKLWIDKIDHDIANLSNYENIFANNFISLCKEAHKRIDIGIELLASDQDVRLAFCFANKALDIQRRWDPKNTQGQGLEWRPFQLAFFLLTLESITNPDSSDRMICDLLWIPTGAGKTEAYLAIAAYTMAYRRRRAMKKTSGDRSGAGVSVITRYTLRLLTIQQFRRALATVTACEYLRTEGKNPMKGWSPQNNTANEKCIWGTTPFSLGLWVGKGVTPNKLLDSYARATNRTIYGAISILKGHNGEGEPAQILNCPSCNAILSVSQRGLSPGEHKIHFIIKTTKADQLSASAISSLQGKYAAISLKSASIVSHKAAGYYALSLTIETNRNLTNKDIDNLWKDLIKTQVLSGVELVSVHPSRPGYFIISYLTSRRNRKEYDFSIFCPNPQCKLIRPWSGKLPSGMVHERTPPSQNNNRNLRDDMVFIDVPESFRSGTVNVSDRIPIPALTTDEQIYRRVPSMLVATVDKFARLPFEERSSGLFGNVDHHHCMAGYYRRNIPAWNDTSNEHPTPGRFIQISSLDPPDLILQDELHLIEGPLGSLVGFYETVVDFLSREDTGKPVKYIASTATVYRAEEHVKSIFDRKLLTFPPRGLTADDRFFVRDFELHPLDSTDPGRVYMGIFAPGRGPLTPLIRIWARLLQTAFDNRQNNNIDPFWTLTGYFNARRELAGAKPLYRQDIQQRLEFISGGNPREIPDDSSQELSSRTDPTELPSVLGLLETKYPDAQDALFTTSMFGTGVDISRIGLMVVHGQPKTTSAYIQSTGRVGRTSGALVVTFLRASRPRDLNHYEFFCGYHRQLHRYVEPLTAYPFAPGVIGRAGGPVIVTLLRHMRNTSQQWYLNESAHLMGNSRATCNEIDVAVSALETRAANQPGPRAAAASEIRRLLDSGLDLWQNIALLPENASIRFYEYSMWTSPKFPVVLGDSQHQYSTYDTVYRNTPQSLRDVEETTGFET